MKGYPTLPAEKAHNLKLWAQHQDAVKKMTPDEHKGIERVIHCVSIAKHSAPEDVHRKLEHYLNWLVE